MKQAFLRVAVTIAILAGLYVWLRAAPVIGTLSATPAYIVVNTATPVLFTAEINDRQLKKRSVVLVELNPSGKPSDILGRLHDDGRTGDLKAGDNIYSLRLTLNEPTVGSFPFAVAARFKPGSWPEVEPGDDDWDRELAAIQQLRRDRPSRLQLLLVLLKRLARYQLSDPVSITVDPIPLPPDPGEVGKQTLAGVDSDSDGVRDDLQRYIAFSQITSAATRAALEQTAVADQTFLLNAGAPLDTLLSVVDGQRRAEKCLDFVVGVGTALNLGKALRAELLNTQARSLAYVTANSRLSGRFFTSLAPGPSHCAFDPNNPPN